ncbi:hypothetical protein GF324_01485 [bacterium]|nr:hypothetical protein [bacterium]MBD3239361.1 hypothetical protein [Chitinivibrionales bacterium]
MTHHSNVVLIGFKSCGKTTAGRVVAQSLHKRFVDLDETVEREINRELGRNCTCADYYAQYGAASFRKVEQRALQHHRHDSNIVLATGGGAPVDSMNRKLLKEIGTVCYIKTPPHVLLARYEQTRMPPFLEDEPTLEALTRIWRKRDEAYRCIAELVLEAGELPAHEVARLLMHMLAGEAGR